MPENGNLGPDPKYLVFWALIVPFQRAYKYVSNEPLKIQRWRIILQWTKNRFIH